MLKHRTRLLNKQLRLRVKSLKCWNKELKVLIPWLWNYSQLGGEKYKITASEPQTHFVVVAGS